jgi:GT2 family glycosyltransferase
VTAVDELLVVILVYGTGGEYEPLLDALLREGVPPGRIAIVHNPAEPGEPAPAVGDGCEVIEADRNLGYAAGMNLGIERQQGRDGDLLLLLTHDARLRAGALAGLVEAARRNPEYGVLGPALMWAGTDTPFSLGGITRANGTVAHLRHLPDGAGEIAACDWVDGGTMLLRTELLRRVGGFDERFWAYCEDADLCLRACRAGFPAGVVRAAEADQAPGGTKRPGPWAYLTTRNGAAYAHRARGLRGLSFFSARALLIVAENLARALARLGRLRRGPPADPWAVAVGTGRGLLDLARGRWGPPPRLPGAGDLRNVAGPPG